MKRVLLLLQRQRLGTSERGAGRSGRSVCPAASNALACLCLRRGPAAGCSCSLSQVCAPRLVLSVELLHGECCLESLHCTCKARNEQVSIVAACASMSAAGSNWEGVSSTLAQGGARGARAQAKATRRRTGPTHCHPPVGGSENHAFSLGARG